VDSQNAPAIQEILAPTVKGWNLPQEFIGQLLAHHTPVNYEKGSVLFVAGSPADILFFVFDGLIRVYASRADGVQSTFMLAGPGDFLGFANSSGRNGKVHCLDASTVTKCSVALFTRRYIAQLLATLSPPTLRRLIEDMNTAWSKALLWYINFFRMSFRERLALVLHELGLKFGKPTHNGILVSLKLGHDDFAEMIGCSRPVIGKVLSEMISAGAIELPDHGGILLREPPFAPA
jgi:CRP/FNR family cyclic AMP-dependent transcriptional regulator